MWNPVLTVSIGTFLNDVRIVGDFFRAQRARQMLLLWWRPAERERETEGITMIR